MHRLTLPATAFVSFCAGGLYGWSALIAPLQATFDVSTAQTGLVFSIAIACFTLSVMITPFVLARIAQSHRLAVFALGGATSLMLASVAPSYSAFVFFFSAGFGSFSGAIYISSLAVAAQSAHPLKATPLVVAAFGIGGAVFGPAWHMLETTGLGMAMLLPLALALVLSAAAVWYVPYGRVRNAEHSTTSHDTVHNPRGRALFLIWLIFAFGSFGGLMVLGLAAKMLDHAAASFTLSSVTLAGVALGNTLGRISVAGLSQVFQPTTSVFVALAVGGIGMLVVILVPSSVALATGVCLIAGGYGVLASAIPTLTRAIFGAATFDRRFALIFSAWGAAGFCAPWITGAIFDATGSFDGALFLSLGTTTFGALATKTLWLSLRPRS